jgi:integrase
MSTSDGKGIRTIRVIHSILHKSLDDALRLGLISRNPVDLVVPPRYTHGEMKIYDRKQVQLLMIAARDDRNEALFFLAVTTGCRMSELLALKWGDLSWEGQTLHVQRQLARDRQNGYYLPLKTKAANRTIDLGKKSIEKLREHYQRQNQESFKSKDWQENDLIFSSSLGTPQDQFNLYHQFKSLIENAGLPEIRFHDLRHTAASLMINDGLPIIVVSRRLGHTKVSTTMDIYGHLLPDTQRELADRIDNCVMPIELELHPNCTRTPDIQELAENPSPIYGK